MEPKHTPSGLAQETSIQTEAYPQSTEHEKRILGFTSPPSPYLDSVCVTLMIIKSKGIHLMEPFQDGAVNCLLLQWLWA